MQTVDTLWPYARKLVYADNGASLEAIHTIMVAHDVSHLPLLEHDRHKNVGLVRRKVIWKKMMASGGVLPTIDEVREKPLLEVDRSESLAKALELLDTRSALIIRGDDHRCERFLSPRVVAKAMQGYAERFQIIESLEEVIRRRLDVLSSEDLTSALQRKVGSPSELTFGEYHEVFAKLWDELDLKNLERSRVLVLLNSAREYRNAVMHFRFDEQDAGMSDVQAARRILES